MWTYSNDYVHPDTLVQTVADSQDLRLQIGLQINLIISVFYVEGEKGKDGFQRLRETFRPQTSDLLTDSQTQAYDDSGQHIFLKK